MKNNFSTNPIYQETLPNTPTKSPTRGTVAPTEERYRVSAGRYGSVTGFRLQGPLSPVRCISGSGSTGEGETCMQPWVRAAEKGPVSQRSAAAH